jgi:invasion protein IalB
MRIISRNWTRGASLLLCLGLGATLIGPAARAAEIGTYGAWYAMTSGEGGEKLCYAIAGPQVSLGKIPDRGEVGLMVTHLDGGAVRDQVSVALGFEPSKSKPTKIKVDKGGNINMRLNDGDRVWIREASLDRRLVAQMKKGDNLIVTGLSAKGVASQDTFSLDGFSKAYQAISEACGVQ